MAAVMVALIVSASVVASAALWAGVAVLALVWWRQVAHANWAVQDAHLDLDREAYEAGAAVPDNER